MGCHTVRYDAMNQVLIDCSGPPDEPRNEETGMARKRDALLSQLERRMALRTLVFCNTIQGCRQASCAVDSIYYKVLVPHSVNCSLREASSNRGASAVCWLFWAWHFVPTWIEFVN